MTNATLPARNELTICFAHPAYQLAELFDKRHTGISHTQARTPEALNDQIGDAHVLVVSGLWRNDLLDRAPHLRYIQSIGAGYDQFPLEALRSRGIRLANASGVNRNAVGEHAMALILAFARHIHTGRDHQRRHYWRPLIPSLARREDELGGKTLLIVGLGAIGSRLARLAKAFDMQILATKRNIATAQESVDELHTPDRLPDLLPRADFVVLTCPLTPQTKGSSTPARSTA